MAARRLSLAAASAFVCTALALWVSLGAITITGTDARARVGILPSPRALAALVGVALAVAAVARPRPRGVAALWLSALLLLPWLPGHMPLSVFIWAGPARFWLWAVIAATLVVSGARRVTSARVHRLLTTPQSASLCAAMLGAGAFAAGAWAVSPSLPTGDEPHYLVITQSLLNDRDLLIENNHQQGDDHAYFGPELKPHSIAPGVDGKMYSVHAPGLPALIAPAFRIYGYRGVMVMLVAIAALAGGLAWLAAWRVAGDASASWFGWAAVTLSAPFFFHAFAVYPDGVGAALVLLGVLPLLDERAREHRALLIVGAALGFLPWLHTRFAILAAALAVVIVARIATNPGPARRATAFFIVPMLSAAGWFAFFFVVYGVPNPMAPYGGGSQFVLAGIGRGAAGLLFDHQFGLLPNAPAYLCALAGLAVMLAAGGGRRRLAVELLIVTLPYFLTVAAFPMWWAGFSAPARFLVPLAPVLAIPTAVWFATLRTETARILGLGAILLSAIVVAAIALTDRGALMFNVRDGASILALAISPVVNLAMALPSSFRGSPAQVMQDAAVWSLAIVAAVVVGRAFERRRWRGQSLATIIGGTAAVWALVATSLVWRINRATAITSATGGLALVQRYRPDSRQIGIAYASGWRVRTTDVPPPILLADRVGGIALNDVPAGDYEIESSSGAGAQIRAGHDRHSPPIDEWAPAAATTLRRLVLPVGVAALRVNVVGRNGGPAPTLSMHARLFLGGHESWPGVVAAQAARYGPATVFLVGGRADIERGGMWIRGSDRADFVIVPDSGSAIQLFLRNAPVENRVVLESGPWRDDLVLGPREERLVAMPTDTRHFGTALRVASRGGVSPAEVDHQSDDRRVLGCFIETR